MSQKILSVTNLSKYYKLGGAFSKSKEKVHAVDNVSFDLYEAETLGIVGESGCGKSTLGRMIVRLEEPTKGTITFEGEDLTKKSNSKLRSIRKRLQMIFQDPYASLNPRMVTKGWLWVWCATVWPRARSRATKVGLACALRPTRKKVAFTHSASSAASWSFHALVAASTSALAPSATRLAGRFMPSLPGCGKVVLLKIP